MPGRRQRALPAWLIGSGIIAVAMGLMNLGTYGFTILAARLLGPESYGALAAVMGLLLVVSVVPLGLQATAARRVSATPEHTRRIEAEILAASYRSAAGLGVLCLLATPLVTVVLDLETWWTAALLALTVVPLTVTGGQAGVLQGERRWLPLAMVYLCTGVGRIGCGAAGLVWRPDELGAMTGVAVGAFLPTVVGWLALRQPSLDHEPAAGASAQGGLLRELVHNSHALLAFFALSNADVVIARSILPEHDAGLYAAGLILTKAVLFLPQFVVVVLFPSMARSEGSQRAHLTGLLLVLGIGVVTTVGVVVLSGLAVVFVGGGEYAELQSRLWGFAVLGTLLALLQLMVYDVVAKQHQRAVFLIWTALAVLLAAAPFLDTLGALLVTAGAADTVLLLALLARSLAGRGSASPDPSRGAATPA